MNALKRFIPLSGLMLVIAYLGFHAWTGEQGIAATWPCQIRDRRNARAA
jgi:cell division protein FtsB